MSSLLTSLPEAGIAPGVVRVLSDLHLGHDISTVETVESLRPLIAGARTVIFNGDTLQERGTAFRQKSLGMVAELQAMCAEEGADPVFLRGNHDPTAWDLELLDLAGGLVTVTHGDVWLRLISPWSRNIVEARPLLEAVHARYSAADRHDLEKRFEILQQCRLALPPSETRQSGSTLAGRAGLFFREIWPPTRPLEVLKVYARLPGLASAFAREFRPQCQVLLFGHTHRAKIWHRSGRLLVNTGAFVTFARPAMVEIENRRLSVWRLEHSSGVWRKSACLTTRMLAG